MISWTGSDKPIGTIGVIGAGNMGKCIISKLIEQGRSVTVFDAFPEALRWARDNGAGTAPSPLALAKECAVIIMSLPGPAQIETVLFGEAGMYEGLSPDSVLVDTSTVDPDTTKTNARRTAERGAAYLDCPILGRPSAAGKWLLPTGGDSAVLDYVRPVLLAFAREAIHVGESGAGNALKLLNQMMFSAINAVTCETLAIADHVGIDRKIFYETVANSGAATVSGLFKEVGKNIVDENFDNPTFTVDLLIKDARFALEMAKAADAPSIISSSVQTYNQLGHASGMGNLDTSALVHLFEKLYQKDHRRLP
ncbi:NAD(P)-dependent oxidoreductase [Breznakiella homolactica]|uniref:NAD(P)-dependent oxidoreductase n=1 Tax=Breznakiella homolactica TaxID=2798577 RepID=A0A7T7XM90_9SPIR|nr:NAD(P)-dependent oxidoreductase [Breznakiella homolactica]QQO08969.1 NAD(P)-dependent oxidoreductase [Breznakiella homolactica]